MSAPSLEEIARRHHLRLVLQFGSSVTGRAHARSDVDVAVLLDRPLPAFEAHGELLHDLQGCFPDREVDLVVLNTADPLLLRRITEGCRLLYGSTRQLAELKIYAYKRYQDHRRFLAMERDYVARVLAR